MDNDVILFAAKKAFSEEAGTKVSPATALQKTSSSNEENEDTISLHSVDCRFKM